MQITQWNMKIPFIHSTLIDWKIILRTRWTHTLTVVIIHLDYDTQWNICSFMLLLPVDEGKGDFVNAARLSGFMVEKFLNESAGVGYCLFYFIITISNLSMVREGELLLKSYDVWFLSCFEKLKMLLRLSTIKLIYQNILWWKFVSTFLPLT